MRFIHTADLHLGKRLHEFSLIEDQQYILSQILDLAAEHQAEALLIAGDIYDKAIPSAEAMALWDDFLTRGAELGLSCLVVSGNHDSPSRLAFGSQLLRSQGLHLARPFSGGPERVSFNQSWGGIDIWLLPFIKPLHVRQACPEAEDVADYHQAISHALSRTEPDPSRANLLIAHQFVTHQGESPLRSESETLSLGGLDNVEAEIFAPFDYVALGHIHRPQSVSRPSLRYAGSPLAYSFSEGSQEKSVVLVDVEGPGQVEVSLLPLSPRRGLRQLSGSLDQLLTPTAQAAAGDDYLRISLTDRLAVDALSRLRAVYPRLLRLDFIYQAAGDNLPIIGEAKTDPVDMFRDFYREQNGCDLAEEQLSLVRSLLTEGEEAQ